MLLTGRAGVADCSSVGVVEHITAKCGSEVAESEVGWVCVLTAPASLPRRCLHSKRKPL